MKKEKIIAARVNVKLLKNLKILYPDCSNSTLIKKALVYLDQENIKKLEKSLQEKLLYFKEERKLLTTLTIILKKIDWRLTNIGTNINQVTHNFHLNYIQKIETQENLKEHRKIGNKAINLMTEVGKKINNIKNILLNFQNKLPRITKIIEK